MITFIYFNFSQLPSLRYSGTIIGLIFCLCILMKSILTYCIECISFFSLIINIYGVRGNVILRDTASMTISSVQIANSATQDFTEPVIILLCFLLLYLSLLFSIQLEAMAKYISEGKRIILFYTLSSPGVAFFKALKYVRCNFCHLT